MTDRKVLQRAPVPAIRQTGISLWRQIADSLRGQIFAGTLPENSALPPEAELAARYGVNRHTLRVALRTLREEGLLVSEQGRGTFVRPARKLVYRLAERTRLTDNLAAQGVSATTEVIEDWQENASADNAETLALNAGDRLVTVRTRSMVDGRMFGLSVHTLSNERFPDFAAALREEGSVTRAFAVLGIADYRRGSTTISARPADPEEAGFLSVTPGALLLVSDGIDVDPDLRPLQIVRTCFPADTVEFRVDLPGPP